MTCQSFSFGPVYFETAASLPCGDVKKPAGEMCGVWPMHSIGIFSLDEITKGVSKCSK